MNNKGCATAYNNYKNIIIITTFARLIITNHQIAIASNSETFNIRLFSATIIMLSKTEFKTQHKRSLNLKSNHFSSLSDFDSIINFFVRNIRKRLKHINILSNQNTFKSKSFILLTIFISPLSFISSNQRVFKSRSFTFFILINITREQVKAFKIAFFKIYSNKRIFERDFSHYNKILNKTSH